MSKVTHPDTVLLRVGKLLRVLRKAGLSDELLDLPVKDLVFRQALVDFWTRQGVSKEKSEPVTLETAREIMGRNFLDIAEALRHYNIAMTGDQHELLAEIPFSEDILCACKDSHILVADLDLSILEVRKWVGRELFFSTDSAWNNPEQFAGEKVESCWRLIRKDMVPEDSTNRTSHEQKKLISEEDEMPSARAMVYIIILNYLVTGERMFENIYVRTSTVCSYGYHVSVGRFDRNGLDVDGRWRPHCYDNLGVASSRK